MPERVKYRKMHRGNRAGLATRGQTVAFGEYGLMALERCWLDTKQIEAARVAIARNMKRHGKMWIRVFPQKSFTKKPLETRMGKGKGPAGILGGRHSPGQRPVRSRWRYRGRGPRVPAPGRHQAAYQNQIHFPSPASANAHMKKSQRKEIQEKTRRSCWPTAATCARRFSTCACSRPALSSKNPARLRTLRRDIARIETRITALRKKAA